jgi:hypothetical protein
VAAVVVAVCCCSVYGQELVVEISLETEADAGRRLRYEYVIDNLAESEVSLNAFLLDVETGADIQDIEHPPGWIGEYAADEDPFELGWVAQGPQFEIPIGGSGTFSFTSALEPGPIFTYLAKLTPQGDELAGILDLFDGPAIRPPSGGIPGDYNDSGLVEQGDLDLVLGNWGGNAATPPIDWSNDLPEGFIDQDELDGVLGNWGRTEAAGSAAVPEPASCLLVLASAALVFARRAGARRRPAQG